MNEPTPPRRTRRRRINPDRPPFDQLPLITADSPEGPIHTTRGTLDLDKLTDTHRDTLLANPGTEYVVFTNRLGQHLLAARDQLIAGHLDLTRIGTLPLRDDVDMLLGFHFEPEDLERLVFEMNHYAQWYADLAGTFQSLIDEGWQLHTDEAASAWGDIVDHGPRLDGASPDDPAEA